MIQVSLPMLFGLGLGIILIAVIVLTSMALGAFIMFRGTSINPGTRFFKGAADGKVFNVTDPLDGLDFPDSEDTNQDKLLSRTSEFLNNFAGGGGK